MFVSPLREPLILGNKTYKQISDDICAPVEGKPTTAWMIATTLSGLLALTGFTMIGLTITYGIGMWGLNKTVGWAWDITNFVWWIGIGHAGTLISAILLLFRQKWRTGVNRSAEAMTIFAVICAGLFPIIHMGRVWLAFLSSLIRIHVVLFGRTLTLHYYGTYLRSLPILQFHSFSGIQV